MTFTTKLGRLSCFFYFMRSHQAASTFPGTVYIHNSLPLKRCVFSHLFGPLPPWQRKKNFQPTPLPTKTLRFRQKLCQLGKFPQQNDGVSASWKSPNFQLFFCLDRTDCMVWQPVMYPNSPRNFSQKWGHHK